VFPNGKHDDQADSTAQFLDWFKKPMPNWAIFEVTRQRAQELEQRRRPPPVQKEWAHGCMEWLAEQEKARSTAEPAPVAHAPPDTALTELVIVVGPGVRIRFAPAKSPLRTLSGGITAR